ncbi:excinuclease ABC subunit UvrC [Chlamydiota bacterium]
MPFDVEQLKHFPTQPGVYLMKDGEGTVLYVGKAKNLRARVKQYFAPGRDGREMVPYLTAQVEAIDTVVVTSEKEALILENNLIKQHWPKYNALLKDDKTFFSLMINHKHAWPMLRIVRFKGKPPAGNLYFGPYAHGYAARQTLELLRHLFPLRQCSDRELVSRTRPCILYDMKQCIAPCVNKCTHEEYDRLVKKVIDFLRGHDAAILKELKAELEEAVEKLAFEKAEGLHRTIQYIEKTLEKQKVEQAGMADIDVIALYREADRVALSQLIFREGKLMHSNDRFFLHNAQSDEELLSSFVVQTYILQDFLPHEIALPVSLPEAEALSQVVSAGKKRHVTLLHPQRGNKKSLLEMAEANAKARFFREKEEVDQKEQILLGLEETFHLTNYPERIECFDNSNISGTEPVSAMIVYTDGEKDSKQYRKYTLRNTEPSDDYGALKEVLERRYRKAKSEENLPDLILIDGGKGHLNLALEVLSALDVSTVDVMAIAKEEGRHDRGITAEQIFLPGIPEPHILKPNSPLLFFLQRVRDEAHRFAITFQRQRRKKKSLASALDTLPGIGPVKKQRLLLHFGSLKRILAATPEQWREVPGISSKDIDTLSALKEKRSI